MKIGIFHNGQDIEELMDIIPVEHEVMDSINLVVLKDCQIIIFVVNMIKKKELRRYFERIDNKQMIIPYNINKMDIDRITNKIKKLEDLIAENPNKRLKKIVRNNELNNISLYDIIKLHDGLKTTKNKYDLTEIGNIYKETVILSRREFCNEINDVISSKNQIIILPIIAFMILLATQTFIYTTTHAYMTKGSYIICNAVVMIATIVITHVFRDIFNVVEKRQLKIDKLKYVLKLIDVYARLNYLKTDYRRHYTN